MSTIIQKPVEEVLQQSFLDYGMSVITDRALPDARDGLKPVHRRILYAMNESGNVSSGAYRKSARMVGEVMGKYHPHGDASIYETAVRLAQPFKMSSLLIDGQGNFGSIDGDNPAAMRYTEMRLTRLAGEFFGDIDKETVRFQPNYDGSEREPSVLPAPYPNLLVNGGSGIAVGMASLIPPHNLSAVIETTLHLMSHPDATTADVVGLLKAPDFPTGALVHGLDGFAEAVETGRGRIKVRSKWHEEERGRGLTAIVIDELPYQVVKKDLVAKIADQVREKKIEDIVDIADHSSKEGVRIFISLRKDASPEAVFADLASKTDIEKSFTYDCTVLVNGEPRVLGLKALFEVWIKWRQEVVLKRFIFDRKQAQAKLHLQEGLMAALGKLDEVIALIRSTASEESNEKLRELLSIDEEQAKAILNLRLQKLATTELEEIRAEHARFVSRVAELTAVIDSPEAIRDVIRAELQAIEKRYGHERRTEIGHGISDITREDMIPREDVLIAMTRGGYVKRMPANALQRQNRGTRGKKAMEVGDDDSINFMRQSHSHDSLMVFAASGQVYGIKAYRIPEGTLTTKGRHIRNVIEGLDEEISAVLALPESDPALSVMTITKQGQVKRTALEDYNGATRRGGVKGLGLDTGDSLLTAFTVRDGDNVILVSSNGKSIRFLVDEVRVMGRAAGGVRGMKLDSDDVLIGAAVIPTGIAPDLFLLCIGDKGMGKRTPVADFPIQGRAGGGVIAFNENTKTGKLIAAVGVTLGQDLIMFASNGVSNRVTIADIRETGRSASGVKIIALDEGHTLVSITTTVKAEEDAEDAVIVSEGDVPDTTVAPAAPAAADDTGVAE